MLSAKSSAKRYQGSVLSRGSGKHIYVASGCPDTSPGSGDGTLSGFAAVREPSRGGVRGGFQLPAVVENAEEEDVVCGRAISTVVLSLSQSGAPTIPSPNRAILGEDSDH